MIASEGQGGTPEERFNNKKVGIQLEKMRQASELLTILLQIQVEKKLILHVFGLKE